MALGDVITAIVEVGAGATERFDTTATKRGRIVEVIEGTKFTYVVETTRTGERIRMNRFRTAAIVALIDGRREEPEPEPDQLSLGALHDGAE